MMTDFRDDALADLRARGALAELDAELLGEDRELVELLHRLMTGELPEWMLARQMHECARARRVEGVYSEAEVLAASADQSAAVRRVIAVCRQVLVVADDLNESGAS